MQQSVEPTLTLEHKTTAESKADLSLNYHIVSNGDEVVQEIVTRHGVVRQALPLASRIEDPEVAWHIARLRHSARPISRPKRTLDVIDLFSGAGGLSQGVVSAIRACGYSPRIQLAADFDPVALDVYRYNFAPRRTYEGSVRDLFSVESLFDQNVSATRRTEVLGAAWPKGLESADILIGGPPCQGHSNLNNRTRRDDSRNQLYLWMAAAAMAINAKVVIIENVATVKHDVGSHVDLTTTLLINMGYSVAFDGVLAADELGTAQTRRRHFLIAIRDDVAEAESIGSVGEWLRGHRARLTVTDAISDLMFSNIRDSEYDRVSDLSPENQARVQWLHDEGEYDLPDKLRPSCHRDKEHTYGSVYGRMYGDKPAPTLSTGFLSPGRGRYVHPTEARTLTPHEGARIQGFPDDFKFIGASGRQPGRTQLAKMIGDAVPPPMAFHVALAALSMLRT